MAIPTRAAIGMPPDGAGKKFIVDHAIQVLYTNAVEPFMVNDVVTGSVTGLVGTVMNVKPNGTAGTLLVKTPFDSIQQDFAVGESLLVGGDPIAEVTEASNLIYSQRAQIVGGNNILNAQFVDRQGAASVRFAEGSTTFDGFGGMNTSQSFELGDYQTHYYDDPEVWYTEEVSGGTSTFVPGNAGFLLSTALAGDSMARRTTNFYHPYRAGTGQLILVAAFCGDTGKPGVIRRWGYFDDEDGLFFELNGTSLRFVVRSSVTGTPVDTVYEQHDWNYDRLDGTGTSQMNLDVTKHNLFWINFAWLGVGAVRFGVYGEDGARLQAHTVRNGNIRQGVYMRSPRLPVRGEIRNTSAQGTTSELFFGCSGVKMEGQMNLRKKVLAGANSPTVTVTGTGITPIFGFRPGATHHGVTNRKIALPGEWDVMAYLTGTNNPGRIKFYLIKEPTVTGAGWTSVVASESMLEWDVNGDGPIIDGEQIVARLIAGSQQINLADRFDMNSDEHLQVGASGVQNAYYVCAKPINPSESIDVTVAANWIEV